MLRHKIKRATGIHFDDHALYAVELMRAHGEIILTARARVDLQVVDRVTGLTNPSVRTGIAVALEQARNHYGMRFQNVYTTLKEDSVFVKKFPIFYRKESDNRIQLEWEVRQFLPDKSQAYVFDCFTTRRAAFVVAVRRQAIEMVTSICRNAGISRPQVDVSSFALCNAMESSCVTSTDWINVLLDFSRDYVMIILINKGELQAVETCNWDGRHAMYGQTEPEMINDVKGEKAQSESMKVDLFLRSFEKFTQRELGTSKPDHVWLSGSHALSGGWSKEIENQLSFCSSLFDPFLNMDTTDVDDNVENPFAYAIASGLAFRGLSEV
tara:strand:+ start:1692 stop:2666 length:975 start_codon:yes stop_codon:yes gene_type:complete